MPTASKTVKPKIHVVYDESTPQTVRLVRALTAAGAMKHCYPKLVARVAGQEDLEKHLPSVKVEDANVD